jgi:hypothetical protein
VLISKRFAVIWNARESRDAEAERVERARDPEPLDWRMRGRYDQPAPRDQEPRSFHIVAYADTVAEMDRRLVGAMRRVIGQDLIKERDFMIEIVAGALAAERDRMVEVVGTALGEERNRLRDLLADIVAVERKQAPPELATLRERLARLERKQGDVDAAFAKIVKHLEAMDRRFETLQALGLAAAPTAHVN